MSLKPPVNYYDLLQINPQAEIETIDRVYRILAARYHPDNQQTGDAERFRLLTDAYQLLKDPVKGKNTIGSSK
jgi:DnaJ-class molecular chaperone